MTASMEIESLSCPSCGAPLTLPGGATAAICHYCNSALRARPSSASSSSGAAREPTVVTADRSIATAAIARIKQLLLLGKRADAVALYEDAAHCDRTTAEATVDAYAVDAVWSTLAAGRLNAAGMAVYACATVMLASGLSLGVIGSVPWLPAAGMAVLGLAWMLFFGRRALRTLHYVSATAGTATVVRFAFIGKDGRDDSLFRLLLDVRDPCGSTFRAELPLVLGAAHAAAIAQGHRLRVKYFLGHPTSMTYDGELEAPLRETSSRG